MSGKTALSTVAESADGRHGHSHHGHSRSSRSSSASRGNRVRIFYLISSSCSQYSFIWIKLWFNIFVLYCRATTATLLPDPAEIVRQAEVKMCTSANINWAKLLVKEILQKLNWPNTFQRAVRLVIKAWFFHFMRICVYSFTLLLVLLKDSGCRKTK